jgi:hypothetical protein
MAQNGAKVSIVRELGSNVIWQLGPNVPNPDGAGYTNVKEYTMPLNQNPLIKAVKEPGSKIQTPDGITLDADRTIPDPDRKIMFVMEKDNEGKDVQYMYLPVITSEDAIGTADIEDSKFVGNIDEYRRFTPGVIGETGDNDPNVTYYDKIMDLYEDVYGYGYSETPGLNESDNIYKSLVKIQLAPDAETAARSLAGRPGWGYKSEQLDPAIIENATAPRKEKTWINN